MLLTIGLGCAPPAGLPRGGQATFAAAYAAAVGERTITSELKIEVRAESTEVWVVRTLTSQGSWEEGGQALTFDAAHPRPADPWPLTAQHAISSVPARVQLDASGRPTELLDPERWRAAARDAVAAAGLSPEAAGSTGELVEPEGLIADLRRYFPGEPEAGSSWVRRQTLAGVPVERREQCLESRVAGVRTVQCSGEIRGESDRARLEEGRSSTTLVFDGGGMRSHDSSWDAILVFDSAEGVPTLFEPVAGRRLVRRQDP